MQLPKLVKTALDEIRMVALGAQILLGFEFTGVFRQGFESLPQHARYLDGVALVLMTITLAFLITPETYHQIVDVGADTARFHQLISRMAACRITAFRDQPRNRSLYRRRACRRRRSRAGYRRLFRAARSRLLVHAPRPPAAANRPQGAGHLRPWPNHDGRHSRDERIRQMLTEARVVLPGVQALLGFQLISIVSQAFERLPVSSKIVHAVSLGCITVAVLLLIAPAAYHRIVSSGQDTEEVHRVGSWLITGATVLLAFGLSGDLYVVLTKIPPRGSAR